MSSDEAEALTSDFVEHADVAVSLDEEPPLLSSAEVGSSDDAALTEHAPEAAEAEDVANGVKPGVFGDDTGENGTICGDALLQAGTMEHEDAMIRDDSARLADEVGDKDGITGESEAAEPGAVDDAAEEGPPRRRRKASSHGSILRAGNLFTRLRFCAQTQPTAPERFKSPYMQYVAHMWPHVKASLPESADTTEITRRLAQIWDDLSIAKRGVWEQRASSEKKECPPDVMQRMVGHRSRRTKKHHEAPKRSMSAFLLYSQAMRAQARADHPNTKNTDISKLLAERWRQASEEEKRPFIELEKEQRTQYKEAMAAWLEQKQRKEQEALQQRQSIEQLQQPPISTVGFLPGMQHAGLLGMRPLPLVNQHQLQSQQHQLLLQQLQLGHQPASALLQPPLQSFHLQGSHHATPGSLMSHMAQNSAIGTPGPAGVASQQIMPPQQPLLHGFNVGVPQHLQPPPHVRLAANQMQLPQSALSGSVMDPQGQMTQPSHHQPLQYGAMAGGAQPPLAAGTDRVYYHQQALQHVPSSGVHNSFGAMQMLPHEGGGTAHPLSGAGPAQPGVSGSLQPTPEASMHVLPPSSRVPNDGLRSVAGLGADWPPQV